MSRKKKSDPIKLSLPKRTPHEEMQRVSGIGPFSGARLTKPQHTRIGKTPALAIPASLRRKTGGFR